MQTFSLCDLEPTYNTDHTYFCCRKGPAKLGHIAKSGDEEVTTTQCEAYETTKLGYEYEDISGYENADYEIPVTQSSAYGLISKPGE